MGKIELKRKVEVQAYTLRFVQSRDLTEENKQSKTAETQPVICPECCELHSKATGVLFKLFSFSY